jgi:hypothetical protein
MDNKLQPIIKTRENSSTRDIEDKRNPCLSKWPPVQNQKIERNTTTKEMWEINMYWFYRNQGETRCYDGLTTIRRQDTADNKERYSDYQINCFGRRCGKTSTNTLRLALIVKILNRTTVQLQTRCSYTSSRNHGTPLVSILWDHSR